MTARSGLSSPGRGVGVPRAAAGRGKASAALQWELPPCTKEGEVGRDKGERQIKRKKDKKGTCKADKRQLKGKHTDTICESTKNKVSNVSLTWATQTSSFNTHASDSTWSGRETLSLSCCWLPQLLTHFA